MSKVERGEKRLKKQKAVCMLKNNIDITRMLRTNVNVTR